MKTRAGRETHCITAIGIDIRKDVFHLVGFDDGGQIVLRRKIRRLALTDVFASLRCCVVGASSDN